MLSAPLRRIFGVHLSFAVLVAGGAGTLLPCSTAQAGTVELSGGGQLTGEVKAAKKPDGSTAHAVVRVDDDLAIAVAGTHVRQTVVAADLQEYRQRAAAAGQDAEAQFKLAHWCKLNTLLPQHRYHLTRTIELDPDHRFARAALGYIRHDTKSGWISAEALRRDQGLIRAKRGWVLPEVLASRNQADEADKQSKLWIRKFRRLHNNAIRGDSEAMAEIQAIEDPAATQAIAAELLRSRNSKGNLRSLRMVYVKLLGRLHNSGAVSTLVEMGLNESDELLREESLRQLTQYGASSAVATYAPLLRSTSPSQVEAAARALTFFPDPELAFNYVDALVTEKQSKIQVGSGGTQAGFGDNGVSGLSQGAQTFTRTTSVRHPAVLELLKTIAPGADYGYVEAAWRRHFAALRNPPRRDLRRDSAS
ncbi:HEAT repeat domain-containing protein [Allorhodopirellula solitaria]|uniref:HEAT repeat protein n=1 Tax=Allorhodopirellula solitaria TaxID=2527987 RepID=A0A5C5YG52_9BACT|nr:HEAT repeat domain-containing protein [Allorhodopirellula solitaria]TWT74330.1 hypothetical protein CA85_12180 [Allorhodopirellula solitaria]